MRKSILFFSILFLWTCGGGGGGSSPTEPEVPPIVINLTSLDGQAQKGPFNNGTAINIAELTNTLSPTGRNFSSAITDNTGRFAVANVQLESPYVELRANGFYFNEVSNEISDAQLTLFAISNLTGKTSLNVNILTHLEKNRMVTLMSGDSPKTFAQAKLQAQEEVFAVFDYSRANVPESELLDISQGGAANGKLLAMSAILQGDLAVGQMSQLLANISTDIASDGTLDDASLRATLIDNSKNLDMAEVRSNLVAHYASLGISATIPDFETEINQFLKPPVSQDISASTTEDTAINITLSAADPEGESLTYTILEVNNATVTLSGNVANYVPDTHFNGTDTFTYYANDGTSDSNIATVTMTVSSEDDEPNTIDVATTTDEDVAVTVNLSADEYDGDSYSFAIITDVSNGTTSLNGSVVTYTPNQDWNGTDTFTFEATDDRIMFGKRNVATATITVNAVNDAPVANDITNQITDENRMMQLDITLDATDVDGDALTYNITSTNNGSVTINDNIATYVPNQDWNGEDTFTYTANDGSLDSNTATVTITVNSINDAPVISDSSFELDEDSTTADGVPVGHVYVTDVDETTDGSIFSGTVTLVSVPEHGSLTQIAGTVTLDVGSEVISGNSVKYHPKQDWHGSTESFTWKANDGSLDSNIATVTITVNSVNDIPVVTDIAKSTNEDSPVTFSVHDYITDPDGDSTHWSYFVDTQSTNGTVTVEDSNNGNYTYTPNADWNGTDSFTWYIYDDGNGPEPGNSNVATTTITVNPVNDAPTTADIAITMVENRSARMIGIELQGSDVEGDDLTYAVVNDASNGSTDPISSGYLHYFPNDDWNGTETITYKANDGSLDSNTSTITVTVTSVNDAPVTTNASASTNENTNILIDLSSNISDIDTSVSGGLVSSIIVSLPSNGTLYQWTDGSNAPSENTLESNVPFNNSAGISKVWYTPNANWSGTDTFTFKANDGADDSNISTMTITINEAPTVTSFTLTTDEDVPANIVLQASDDSTTDLQYQFTQALKDWEGAFEGAGTANSILSQDGNVLKVFGGGGTAVFDDSLVVFTPGKDQHTASWSAVYPDTLKYRAYDGMAYSEEAEIIINVNPVNDAPYIEESYTNKSRAEDFQMGVNGFDMSLYYAIKDADYKEDLYVIFKEIITNGGNLNFSYNPPDNTGFNKIPAVGDTLQIVNYDYEWYNSHIGSLSFLADLNFNGDAGTFTVTGWDGELESDPATWTITVTPVNDLPEADDQSVTTDEDTAVDITVSATDVDGDDLSYSISTAPSNGTASISGNVITYTPSSNFNGTDTIDFKASDGTSDQNPNSVAIGTITITVNAVNDAPTTEDVSTTIDENRTARIVGITLDGSDIDGDDLTYSVVADASNGTTSISGATLTYTANQDWNGTETITYKANDGTVDSNTSTITVTVTAVNDGPVSSNVSVSTNEDTAKAITLSATDVDTGASLTYSIVSNPSNGSLGSVSGANVTYTPNANWNGTTDPHGSGTDTFTYKANDGTVDSNTSTVTISVKAINDAPTTNDVSASTNEDTAVNITLDGDDVDIETDGNNLTYSIVNDVSIGSISISGRTVTYTPTANWNGTTTFTYKANDGSTGATSIDSNISTVTITVNAINDAPIAGNGTIDAVEDDNKSFALNDYVTDIDTGFSTASMVYTITETNNGTLTRGSGGSGPVFVYRANTDWNGTDTFTYQVTDNGGLSDTGVITVNVAAVNDAPVASNVSASGRKAVAKAVTLSATDLEGDNLTYSIVSDPSNGTVSVSGSTATYTSSFSVGTDTFTYKANDGTADSNTATVSISVTNPFLLHLSASTDVDNPKYVSEDSSGNYVVASNDRIQKFDYVGNEQFRIVFDDSEINRLQGFTINTDGDYIICGEGNNDNNFYISKYSSSGSFVSQHNTAKPSGFTTRMHCFDISQTLDGGYILGATNGGKSVLFKFDSSINKTNELLIDQDLYGYHTAGSFNDRQEGFADIHQAADGGYVIATTSHLVKIGNNLTDYIWSTSTVGSTDKEGIKVFDKTSDGGFIMAVRNINTDASYTISKYNSNGSLESSSIPTVNNTHARIYDVLETSSGEYVVVGAIRNTSTNRTDLFVQKMSSGFSILWTKTFHEDDFSGISLNTPNWQAVAKSVTETSEGSFVVVGSLSRRLSTDDLYNGGHEGSVLIKLDADGEESRTLGW